MSRGRRRIHSGTNVGNQCSRCGDDIRDYHYAVRTARGQWIHKSCASGADDE